MGDFTAQKGIPFLSVPLALYDNKEFMRWMGTAECRVWHKMNRHIVRGEMITGLNKKIFEEYYKKGILAMYKDQQEVAEFLGISNKSQISRAISSMVESGIILLHKDVWNNRSINIYELGVHDMGPNKHENLHLHVYFTKLFADKILETEFVS